MTKGAEGWRQPMGKNREMAMKEFPGSDYYTVDRESRTVWPISVVAALVLVACVVFTAYTLIN